MTPGKMRSREPALAAILLCAALAGAPAAAQPVAVRDAWVRAPAPGQKVAGAYMEFDFTVQAAVRKPGAGTAHQRH